MVCMSNATIAYIDDEMKRLHDVFANAFAGGAERPAGVYLADQSVFESIWIYLASAYEIRSYEKLTSFYNGFLNNFDLHLPQHCNVNNRQHVLTESRARMLKSVVQIHHVLMSYRFHLRDFSKHTPDKFRQTMTDLMKSCDKVEQELAFVDKKEAEASMKLLSNFMNALIGELNKKRYTDMSANNLDIAVADGGFILFRAKLEIMPSISDLNASIGRLNAEGVSDKEKAIARNEINRHIQALKGIIASLISEIRNLKTCNDTLNDITARELKAEPHLVKLKEFSEIVSIYNLASNLGGHDQESLQQRKKFAVLSVALDAVIKECSRQSTAEKLTAGLYSYGWGPVASEVAKIKAELPARLTEISTPYLEQAREVGVLVKRIHEIDEKQSTIGHVRTQLAALIAKTQGVLTETMVRLGDAIDTLNEYIETSSTYVKSFMARHFGEIVVGAGTGSGATTAAAYFALTQPHLAAMAVIGALFGSAAGVSVGMARDQFGGDKVSASSNHHKINLIDGVRVPFKATSDPRPPRRWYKPWSLFGGAPDGGQPHGNDIMRLGRT